MANSFSDQLKNYHEHQDFLLPLFNSLAQDSFDLNGSSEVPRVSEITPLEFYRQFVSTNRPCIIENAIQWPALSKWTNEYLDQTIGGENVTVDITPNGYGDAIVDDKFFVIPESRNMTFSSFLETIRYPEAFSGIYYIQHQNNNFSKQFDKLWKDIGTIEWATTAFGCEPDAINFWMGNSKSVSSLHKDHYENMYVVVAGEKKFTLYPPTDYYFLYELEYQKAAYKEIEKGKFEMIKDDPPEIVPWISVDPDFPDFQKYPLFQFAHPIHVTLKKGEVLYLPSMYFHHVGQGEDEEKRTIAVNFWYDMEYDSKYCYFQFMENVRKTIQKMQPLLTDEIQEIEP